MDTITVQKYNKIRHIRYVVLDTTALRCGKTEARDRAYQPKYTLLSQVIRLKETLPVWIDGIKQDQATGRISIEQANTRLWQLSSLIDTLEAYFTFFLKLNNITKADPS